MERHHESSEPTTDGDERPRKRRRHTGTASHPSREVGLMRSVTGDKISFIGSSSGVHFIRSVYSAFRSQASTAASIASPEIPGEDDHLPSASPNITKPIWRADEVSPQGLSTMSFQKLVEWSRSYFSNWHPAYPFLHAPAMLDFFERLSQGQNAGDLSGSEPQLIVMKAVMSISLADRRQGPSGHDDQPYPPELVFQSYDEASNSVQHAVSQPVSMQSLQAALSVQLFLVSMLRFNAASRLGGLIIRMALQLGLHRCSQRYPSFSHAQRELRQRVFFSLYCIDRFICQSTGLPLSLRDDDIDVCYPSLEQHTDVKSPSDRRLRLMEFMSRYSHIRGEIMEFKHKSIQHAQQEGEQAIVITSKLSKLANDVDEFIDFDETDPPTLSPFHKTLLKILYHESVISLNRPIIASNPSGPVYEAALQQCIGSARAIITLLHGAIAPSAQGQRGSFRLLWPSFTWAVWMSTFILFHASQTKQLSIAMVTRLAEKSLVILELLACRGSVWPEACGAAIKDLRAQLIRARSIVPKETSAIRPGGLASSPCDNATIAVSPHVVAGSPTQALTSTRDPTQAHLFGDSAPSRPGTGSIITDRGSREPRGTNNRFCLAETNPHGWTSDSTPGLPTFGEPPPNEFVLDQFPQSTNNENQDPFTGFDIPFWLGQDQYSGMVNEWS